MLAKAKHFALLQAFANYKDKKFYKIGPLSNVFPHLIQ
jgi:hypothetical protein